ncbi:hypothetical protein [Deinococcus metallilatus]|uniref:Uncharacterized protein n=1 Tax=Deinococcus metallilatus TaxID=1211322 RepID=A0AAJ5JYQ5_9DEIO|nr:hypothetical protein [Deinococcus metallilatus]MBB5297190.1 hypothetical protein [Deinococcus metallilatus]RXJ17330.1 hypothetical protein ERJ73_01975 [Deinococcus metallilatus]TLK21799.1 hypothetical protein FCS05_18620 [Deinococcus metallilatus]
MAWEEKLIRDGFSLETIADYYVSLDRTVPLTRAAILFNRLHLEERRDAVLSRANSATTVRLEQLYVSAVSYSTRRGRSMLLSDNSDMPYGDLLQQFLSEVRTLQDTGSEVSRPEAEYRVLEALHYDSIASGDNARAIVVAKEMILLATLARVPDMIERARRYYRSAIAQAGRYHEDLTERLRVLQGMTPANKEYIREKSGLVIAQLNVGDLEGALTTAQEEPVLPLHGAVVQAVKGHFHTSDTDHFSQKIIGWIALCLWHLAKIESVPPWRVAERRALATAALEVVREQHWRTGPTDRPFVLWLEAKCRLEAGEYGLVRHLTNEVANIEDEDLLSRTLLAGMRLDLALTDEAFQTQTVIRSEDELRRVFDYARELRHGSAPGLAEVLKRWHPRSSAYMALCPVPIPELLSATETVLRCHKSAEVYGQVLPPLVALDEVLRAFGFPAIQAQLGSNARYQRRRLLVRNGDMEYWRPVIVAPQLVIGLLSVKSPEHQNTAERLGIEYGLIPTNIPKRLDTVVGNLVKSIQQKMERFG